jgi:cytochrome P450
MMKLGLRIASTTLFSADISGDADAVGKAFRVGFKHISDRMNSLQLIPNWLPTSSNRAFARAKRVLDQVVADLISTRRQMAQQPDDLLAMLLSVRDEQTGQGMPERLLMDEVLTLLTAGHENIGSALSWTWYLLAKHPQIQQEVFEEIEKRLRGRPPVFEDVAQLPLLKAVFEESMRLYPPGWGELRETIGPDEIQGYAVPAGSMIILCQWVTHRHPGFWSDPDKFDPTRFLPSGKAHHRFAYFPFGGGPRICIGMQLAMIEAALVIATILQQFRLELVADQCVEPDATFTLRPKNGLRVTLHCR